ncbi:MAG: hypothetical protein AVDCRST_MAG67-203, partial [uncultured Solirubrobacteraceae bacterium]
GPFRQARRPAARRRRLVPRPGRLGQPPLLGRHALDGRPVLGDPARRPAERARRLAQLRARRAPLGAAGPLRRPSVHRPARDLAHQEGRPVRARACRRGAELQPLDPALRGRSRSRRAGAADRGGRVPRVAAVDPAVRRVARPHRDRGGQGRAGRRLPLPAHDPLREV